MVEQRTMYGYPVMPDKVMKAQQYAAEARARNTPLCSCRTCQQQEKLPAVLNIINARSKQ